MHYHHVGLEDRDIPSMLCDPFRPDKRVNASLPDIKRFIRCQEKISILIESSSKRFKDFKNRLILKTNDLEPAAHILALLSLS